MVDLLTKFRSKEQENEMCFVYFGHDSFPDGGFYLHLVHRHVAADRSGIMTVGKPRKTEEVILERNAPYDQKKYESYIQRFQQDPTALNEYFPNLL